MNRVEATEGFKKLWDVRVQINGPRLASQAQEAVARFENLSDDKAVEVYKASYDWMMANGYASALQPKPVLTGPITERQEDYIRRLLARRVGNAGFSGIAYSIESGKTKIESLTKAQASEVIESLTEGY